MQEQHTRGVAAGGPDRNVKIAVFFSSMDWKSTAVISGAGILATWFFSMPPTSVPARAVVPAARAPQTSPSKIDIEKEAARLQVHRVETPQFTQPSRNPFRFNARAEPPRATAGVAAVAPPPVLPPPPPRITLDGVAADTMDAQSQRTAILNTDRGVVLAKEGDEVAGYRVQKIAADAVELVKIDDGSVLRLGLR
jgi:hypothetical protein